MLRQRGTKMTPCSRDARHANCEPTMNWGPQRGGAPYSLDRADKADGLNGTDHVVPDTDDEGAAGLEGSQPDSPAEATLTHRTNGLKHENGHGASNGFAEADDLPPTNGLKHAGADDNQKARRQPRERDILKFVTACSKFVNYSTRGLGRRRRVVRHGSHTSPLPRCGRGLGLARSDGVRDVRLRPVADGLVPRLAAVVAPLPADHRVRASPAALAYRQVTWADTWLMHWARRRSAPRPLAKHYYFFYLGFYVHQMVILFWEPKLKDFYVMLTHHVVTFLLVSFSYCTGCGRCRQQCTVGGGMAR